MDYVDLKDVESHSDVYTDICIVGSGPAGITIAKELNNSAIDVCIVESGGFKSEDDTQALYDVDNIGASRKEPQKLVRQRVFGGSSTTWSGRCAAFDPIDFEKRSWIPHSGWPIENESLTPYLDRATEHLGLGPNIYNEGLFDLLDTTKPTPEIDNDYIKPTFWQFSKSGGSNNPIVFGQDLLKSSAPNLKLFLHANLIHINTDQAGERVESLDFQSLEGNTLRVFAKKTVLCCGGVENARVLLASNKIVSEGVGNKNDMVGRNLIDHIGAVIGTFDPLSSSDIQARYGHYWLDSKDGRQSYLYGLALSDKIQFKEQLLNAAAFLEEYEAPNDPWHALKRVAKKVSKGGSGQYHCNEDDNMFWRDEGPIDEGAYKITFANDLKTVFKNMPSLFKNIYRKNIVKRPPIIKNSRVDLYTLIDACFGLNRSPISVLSDHRFRD